MFEGIRKTIAELREIRQLLRDSANGTLREQSRLELEAKWAQRDAESDAYRKKLERALRRKPNMSMSEFNKRFPIPGRRRTGSS